MKVAPIILYLCIAIHSCCDVHQQACNNNLIHVDFEIFGKVQGVYFRKYTFNKAIELGLVGRVQNTKYGSVLGVVEGVDTQIQEMIQWLQHTGSPHSRIDKATIEQSSRDTLSYDDFQIIK